MHNIAKDIKFIPIEEFIQRRSSRIFAKLYDVEDTQVLFTRMYDSEDDVFKITVTTEIDGDRVSQSFICEDDEAAIRDFNKMTEEDAIKAYQNFCKLLGHNEEN